MTRLAIVGAGNLGSRHLQAIAKLTRPAEVTVIDPDQATLDLAAKRFDEVRSSKVSANYSRSLDALEHDIDVAIIATNADVRAQIVRELISLKHLGALLLEKVLFTKPGDYRDVAFLVRERSIKAWVNCARRAWPFYRRLHERLASSVVREVNVSGVDWGLGCNAIHMLDLAAWLSRSSSYTVDSVTLDNEIRPAKRRGFVEFTGALSGSFENGPVFR